MRHCLCMATDCLDQRMTLASVHTRAEVVQAFYACAAGISGAIGFGANTHAADVGNCWIGLHDQPGVDGGTQGGFQWADRSPVDFLNWYTGQPDGGQLGALFTSLSDEEDCVLMAQRHSGGGWDDWDCSSPSRAIPLCQSGGSGAVAARTSDAEAHALIDNDQLWGRVTFTQTGAAPGQGVEVTVQVRYKVGGAMQRPTSGHSWHIHTTSPVDRLDCTTAGGHYDPAGVEDAAYSCDPANPRTCFGGDLSGKIGPASINGEVMTGHDDALTIADVASTQAISTTLDFSDGGDLIHCGLYHFAEDSDPQAKSRSTAK